MATRLMFRSFKHKKRKVTIISALPVLKYVGNLIYNLQYSRAW